MRTPIRVILVGIVFLHPNITCIDANSYNQFVATTL